MLTSNDIDKIRTTIKEVALTKEDAKKFATKDDLKNLVTKEDAKKFVTKSDLKPIKEDISKIRTSINEIVGFFDEEYLNLRKRVERIEQHLGISASN